MNSVAVEESVTDGMKAAFRRYPTGVAVITTAGPDGPVGLTASSVASVSTAPPALSFSVMGTPTARAFLGATSFVVHLLGSTHLGLAHEFSYPGGRRFTSDQEWDTLPTGEPFLPGALAALRVEPVHLLPVGESTLIVAEVREVFHGPDDGRLIYHRRQFVTTEGI